MRGSLVLCREYRRRMSAWWCRDTARTDQSQCDRTVGEGLFHGRKRPRGLTDRRMGRVVFTKDFPDIALVARRSSLHHKAKIRPHSSGLRRRVGCQCHGLEASDDGGRAREAQRCSNLMRRRFRSATYERIMALRQAGEAGREQDAVPERGVPTGPRGGMRIGLHGGTGSVVMSDLIYRHRAVVPAAAPEPEFGASLSAHGSVRWANSLPGAVGPAHDGLRRQMRAIEADRQPGARIDSAEPGCERSTAAAATRPA
jgi:hypothetical protein